MIWLELEVISFVLGLVVLIASTVWRLSVIRSALEDEFDNEINSIRRDFNRLERLLDSSTSNMKLLQAKHNSDVLRLSDRLNNLSQSLQGIVGYLEKYSGEKYIRRFSEFINEEDFKEE